MTTAVPGWFASFARSLRRAALALAAAAVVLGTSGTPATAQRVYVISADIDGNTRLGTVDVATGAFQQIGPAIVPGVQGFASGPNGSLLTLAFSGDLTRIDPATGLTSVIGPTGLAECMTPASVCGPTAINTLAGAGGVVYATDLQNTLYRVDPLTGAATRIGATGIPGVPFVPLAPNSDGSIGIYDEALFGVGSALYATFDVGTFDPATGVITTVVDPGLYRINPLTGAAMLVGAIPFGLGGVAGVNGTFYAVDNISGHILTLDLVNGSTQVVRGLAPEAGIVSAAYFAPTATPEPATVALVGAGLLVMLVSGRRRRPA
jgi:hypothetical protein